MTSPDASLVAGLADRYRIDGAVGEGGMATVYEAEDIRHRRKVAIKVLRPELAAIIGTERFLKEIEVTANLNHPHVLGLIDSGVVDEHLFYVMPFMSGESLRERLEREQQLPVEDAVKIGASVAAALDYAHRQGVIHRDIKPENILLHDGNALVADFGIALALSHVADQRITATGMSVGTPQYMSPEQASGDASVDARTDIYSLGCVVYEMLTGAPPFSGRTAQAILSAAITSDPTPVERDRPAVPEHVAVAVRKAISKLPADRFQSAGGFAEALSRPADATTTGFPERRPQGRRRPMAAWVVGAVALLGGVLLGGMLAGEQDAPTQEARYFDLLLPEDAPVALTGPGPLGFWQPAVALSPDGDVLAYIAAHGGTTVLAVRPLYQDTAEVLAGTEGAYHPFFSPGGDWIGYFTGNELKKVQIAGGSPVTLTTVDRPTGAAWPEEGEILVFQQDGFEMRRLPASGGTGSGVLLPAQFGAPDVLPGGETVVGHLGSGQLALLSLTDTTLYAVTRSGVIPLDSVRLDDLLIGASPKFVGTAHLVFGGEDGQLMALPFDPEALQVEGGPVPVVDGVRIEEGFGFAQYDIGPDGTLVFVPGRSQLFGQIAFVGEGGVLDTLPLPRGQYTQPRMAPDGRRLAVQQRMPVGGWQILVVDIETGVTQRVPFEGDYKVFPAAWMPDGEELLVGRFHPAANTFLSAWRYTFATAAWEEVPDPVGSYMSVAPDGVSLVYSDFRTGDLYVRSLVDNTAVAVPARGFAATFSPDGRWLAWGGADGGVAVSPLPPTGAVYPVAERGQLPVWRPDGGAILYRDGRRFFEVAVDLGADVRAGLPRLVAEGPFLRTFAWNHTLSPDGRLAALISLPGDDTRELGVITGFDHTLLQRAPPRVDR